LRPRELRADSMALVVHACEGESVPGSLGPRASETRARAEEEPDMGGPHGDGSDSMRARERLTPGVHLSAL
jgi:hypothetical protein